MTEQPFVYQCPICKRETKEYSKDDVGTVFYRCEKDHATSTPIKIDPLFSDKPQEPNPAREEFLKKQRNLQNPITDEELKEMLGSSIKHDTNNKIITFLCMLATYTEEDQINLGFLAGSSTGKSYIPLEIATGYFPKNDLIILGYCSPTAFFHDYGTMLPDPTDTRDIEPEKKRKIVYVDLERKILIFLDQPHMKLLENLRPLLSHDQKEITIKISDRREKSGLRAKTVVICGYPTVVFCSASYKQNEQEKTRMLILSPEHTQEKLRETIALRIQKESDREKYRKELEENPQRQLLGSRVDDVKLFEINQVIIPEELRAQIYEKFIKNHRYLQSRNQRDISRLLSLVKGYALLNFYQRNRVENKETGENTITATPEDVMIGFRYYGEVSQANELGIPPEVYEIYQILRQEENEGFTRKEFQRKFYEIYHRHIGRGQATNYLEALSEAGLLTEETDPDDRKSIRYVCAEVGVTQAETNARIMKCHLKFNIYGKRLDDDDTTPVNRDSDAYLPPPPDTHIPDYSEGSS